MDGTFDDIKQRLHACMQEQPQKPPLPALCRTAEPQCSRLAFMGWYSTSLLSSCCMMVSTSDAMPGAAPAPPPALPPLLGPPSSPKAPRCSAKSRSISSAAGGSRPKA